MASRASRRSSGSAGFVADLERIGDHACGIAKRALELNRLPALESRVDLAKLATLVQNNLQAALDSFVYKGADRATKVITADAEIDKLNASLFAELIAHVAIDPATVTRVRPLTSVCRYLERIGDHVKNLAEDVVYVVRATDVRHRPIVSPTERWQLSTGEPATANDFRNTCLFYLCTVHLRPSSIQSLCSVTLLTRCTIYRPSSSAPRARCRRRRIPSRSEC
jgi:hypothetical protein